MHAVSGFMNGDARRRKVPLFWGDIKLPYLRLICVAGPLAPTLAADLVFHPLSLPASPLVN